jgi:hypothetical protein
MKFRLKVIWADREIGVSLDGDPTDDKFIAECLEELASFLKAPNLTPELDPDLFPSGKLSFF